MAEAQSCDAALRPLLDSLKVNGPQPAWSEVRFAPEETRVLWAQYQSLTVRYGLLYRQFHRPDGTLSYLQIVVLKALRSAFLRQMHNSDGNIAITYLGIKKMQSHVSLRVYWVYWKTDVEYFCRSCPVCQSVQHGVAPRHGKLKLNDVCGPWDRVHVDLTRPHPPSR